MKKIHESEIEVLRVEGTKGHVDVRDILKEPLVAGVRTIAPNSDVPPRPHSHPEAQILYVISGKAKITNLQETIELGAGDFVILEPNEQHYVATEDQEAKLFEIIFSKG